MKKHMLVWTGGDLHSDLGLLCLYVERLANQHGSCKMFKRKDTILHSIVSWEPKGTLRNSRPY